VNSPISLTEIKNVIKKLKTKKSPGSDGFVNEMFKCSSHVISNYLLELFNSILLSGNFPKDWCKGIIYPLHKKGAKSEVNNYRGISLLSATSKLFTKILNDRLVYWAESLHLIPESQAGFRKGYSTIDNIFTLQSMVQKYLDTIICGTDSFHTVYMAMYYEYYVKCILI